MKKIDFKVLEKITLSLGSSYEKIKQKKFLLTQSGKKKVAFLCQMCYADNACKEPVGFLRRQGFDAISSGFIGADERH